MSWQAKAKEIADFYESLPGCTLEQLCKQFSCSPAKASEYKQLGQAFKQHPELYDCASKNEAILALRRFKRDRTLELLSVTRYSEFKYNTLVHDSYHGYMSRKDTRARFDTLVTTLYGDSNIDSLIPVIRNPLIVGERIVFLVCRFNSLREVATIMAMTEAQGLETRKNPLLWISNNKIVGYVIVSGNGSRFSRLNIDDIQYQPIGSNPLETPTRMIKVLLKHASTQYVLDPFCVYGEVPRAAEDLEIKYVGICQTMESYNRIKESMK